MSVNPFMPQQPNMVKAPLLVGTVILGIGIFLFTYTRWGNIVVSLATTIVSTVFLYVMLRNFLVKRTGSRPSSKQFNLKRRQ
ncbi:hypothetical protein BH09BAC1_BH09BAC1_19530 [soil metagenome]